MLSLMLGYVAAYFNSKVVHFHSILLVNSFTEVRKECKLPTVEEVQCSRFPPLGL